METPVSSIMPLIVFPPEPIIAPILVGSTLKLIILGACLESSALGAGIASFRTPKI